MRVTGRVLGILVVLAVAKIAAGQGTVTATVSGTIRDRSGAVLPDAVLEVTGTSLIGGPRRIPVSREGTYHIAALPPGDYELSATSRGFQTVKRPGIRLPAGAAAVIDFSLSVRGLEEAVVVNARPPMVDARSAGVPIRLEQDLLFNLPVARNVAGLINLAPGVSSDVAFGGSQRGNEILVDGTRTTDPMFQDPLARVSYNWVQEVNIAALGANAEFGGFTGVAANAVLRSGSNRYQGRAEYWMSRPEWLDRNTAELAARLQRTFRPRELLVWREPSAQIGGPIVRDRLWFFTGITNARREDRPGGFSGVGSRDQRDTQLLVKPSFAPTGNVRLDGFVQRGRLRLDGDGIGPGVPLEASWDVRLPQTLWNANANIAAGARTLLEVRHNGYSIDLTQGPHRPGTREGPYPHIDFTTLNFSQNADSYFDTHSTIWTTSATLSTHSNFGRGGLHVFKVGAEHERMRVHQVFGYPGGRLYWDDAGVPVEVELWDGLDSRATTGRRVVFGQGEWAAAPRLTIHAGLRLEFNRGSVPLRSATFSTNTVAPRVGAVLDVAKDHRTFVRFHYGHYYDPIFASRIAEDDTSVANPRTIGRVTGPDEFEVVSVETSQDSLAIDENLRHSRVTQTIAGVEHELFDDVSVQAQYIRRRFSNYMGLIDTGSIWAPVQRTDPGPDGALNTTDDGSLVTAYFLTNPGAAFNVYTNPADAYNHYDAVQVAGRKRYSDNWQLQASYTWSRNHGTVGNRWHVNAARFNLGSPGYFVNPNLGINREGRAIFDPTHEAKLLGSYAVPWMGGAMVSAVYRYTTGQAWGRQVFFGGLPSFERVRIEPIGTRRAPALNTADLRVEKTMRLPRSGGTLGVFADVFNVNNQGVPDSNVTNAINDVSGPNFGVPNAWLSPRMLRVGVRASF